MIENGKWKMESERVQRGFSTRSPSVYFMLPTCIFKHFIIFHNYKIIPSKFSIKFKCLIIVYISTTIVY